MTDADVTSTVNMDKGL